MTSMSKNDVCVKYGKYIIWRTDKDDSDSQK